MADVLLIEPDIILALAYRRALERAGWQVRVAASAQAALDCADACRPDVVVLELQLAGHNGVEFLYEFRSYAEWLDVPVIVHTLTPPTAFAQQETLRNQLGVVAYHYKPNTKIVQLIATVREQLAAA
ncbi:MAG TPA: response regulator [Candidatus Saccharimonadales bacterium]|nr:response regulator [Candidatus Saccharimonadales bacterium]